MSLHRSLKTGGKLVRSRNVLTRTERLEKLLELGRIEEDASVFGLPKTKVLKIKAGKKKKKKEAEADEETTEAGE